MSPLHAAHEGTLAETLEPRAHMTARVTTTVVLPPDALTIVAAPPEMISQLNVQQVLGIPARVYLELLRERDCPVAVTCVGKLRLVDRNRFRSWLEVRGKARRAATAAAAAGETVHNDDPLTVEEQVKLGIKPAPRAPTGRG